MVLTRRQTRELHEQASNARAGQDDACDSMMASPDINTGETSCSTPPRVLQAHNRTKEMQGSARKGLQSWPLTSEKPRVKDSVKSSGAATAAVKSSGAATGPVAVPMNQPERHAVADTKGMGNTCVADPARPPSTMETVNLPTGPEPTDTSQIDLYPLRESFVPCTFDELPTTTSYIVENITSTNWIVQVRAMNELRRLAVHHAKECNELLYSSSFAAGMPAIIRAIKSPRSNVSKSAILTTRDLFELAPRRMGDELAMDAALSNSNGILSVLLTKAASNDKKFVVDEAVGALDGMCGSVEASTLLTPLLSGAMEHKNPKVRGRCFVLLRTVMGTTSTKDIDRLLDERVLRRIVVACDRGSTDNTPEARECAREVMCALFKDGGSEKVQGSMADALKDAIAENEQGTEVEGTDAPPSLLLRFVTVALGNNRGKAVLLLDKCNCTL